MEKEQLVQDYRDLVYATVKDLFGTSVDIRDKTKFRIVNSFCYIELDSEEVFSKSKEGVYVFTRYLKEKIKEGMK